MTLRKIVYFVFIALRMYQNWQQRKTNNQHTHRSDLKIGKRHPSFFNPLMAGGNKALKG